jgi:DegV family protein with EDD domain
MPAELYAANGFDVVPVPIILGEREYADGVNIAPADIFAYVDKTGVLPKTSAVPPQIFREFFEGKVKNGDEVVHIGLSSGISALCFNAAEGARDLPGVYVVDSGSLSDGVALLALYARDLRDSGVPAAEIARRVEERTRLVQCSFVIDRLDYLYKGGRCSALSRFASTLLKIKPTIVMNRTMSVGKKYVGQSFKNAVVKYADDTFERHPNADERRAFITYTTAEPEVLAAIKAKVTARGFKEIYIQTAGGTITSHCGPNTLGILYLLKEADN